MVYRAKLQTSDEIYAMKMIERRKLSDRMVKNLDNEVSIVQDINSQNVIKMKDLQKTKKNYYIVYEYCNGGDLDGLIECRKYFDERVARIIIKQIVNGLYSMFQVGAVHRDIKLANLLLHFPNYGSKAVSNEFLQSVDLSKEPFLVKIADLGFAKLL